MNCKTFIHPKPFCILVLVNIFLSPILPSSLMAQLDYDKETILKDYERIGNFGYAADISGNTVFIGEPEYSGSVSYQGAVDVFRFDGKIWSKQQKLIAGDAHELDQFGNAVAISGNKAVISQSTSGGSDIKSQ